MEKVKIIVQPESASLWWGIYGFCEKIGWEDLNIFYENGERIGCVCLNTKGYLRAGLAGLKTDPDEAEFAQAIEAYLADTKCHYWYYYNDKDDEGFHEVPYLAPRNEQGVKPCFMDIWHPDEGIGISTIETAIETWANKHLGIEACEIEIQSIESFEDSLDSFKENLELFGDVSKVEIVFADELVDELSELWKKSKQEVLKKLQNSVN